MKKSGSVLSFIIVCLITCFFTGTARSQDAQSSHVQNLLEQKRFVFTANTAFPLRGRMIQLNSGYECRISPDSLESRLPYYGRAYAAPADPSRAGIEFISTMYSYTLSKRKKTGWDLSIKPKDAPGVLEFIFSISPDGYSDLRVISTNRENISFRGMISEPAGD